MATHKIYTADGDEMWFVNHDPIDINILEKLIAEYQPKTLSDCIRISNELERLRLRYIEYPEGV